MAIHKHDNQTVLDGITTSPSSDFLKLDQTTPQSVTGGLPNFSEGLTVPKTSGKGIKVDTTTPTFGWADLTGDMKDRSPSTSPSYASFNGSIYAYKFPTSSGAKEMFVEYHIGHDYLPGSDVYIHAHWAQNVVDTGGAAGVPGQVKWYFDVTYAKGYGTPGGAARGAWSTVITTSKTQQASTTQYGHMIAEVQLSAASPTASQLDSDDLEVDGIFLVRVYRDANDANDTLDQSPFLLFVDMHYQTNGVIGTKDKNTPFYT